MAFFIYKSMSLKNRRKIVTLAEVSSWYGKDKKEDRKKKEAKT